MKKTIATLLITAIALASTFGATTTVIYPKASLANSTALATNLVVKATSGTLILLLAYNDSASAQYIQVHNATSLPANGAVPTYVYQLASKATLNLGFASGLPMTSGIVICNSSTAATKTIGSADCWFMALYY